jgi:uncharacterized membrane protein YraQ (UPF0718 family)
MLLKFSETLVYGWLGLSRESRLGGVLEFFIYDSIKIFLLLTVMVFAIGFFRTWLPETRLRDWMNRRGMGGNLVAALFGALTPFCSCSSIPIFIGLLKVGVPLGVTFSFLITSPIINEYLVVLMAGSFGMPVTIAYVSSGLLIGTLGGWILGKMQLERHLESDLFTMARPLEAGKSMTLKQRLKTGWDESLKVLGQIWIWVLVGVAAGALIHNYVPRELMHDWMQKTGLFAVPLATALGVPMYGSCAAIVPIAVVLFEKGIPVGTALSFMMAMAALSLPEAIMLRRAMKLPLIALFFGITALAIMATGYLLNALSLLFGWA